MLKDDKQDTGDVGNKLNAAYTSSPTGKVIADDCRHSSKTFAQMYQYSVDVMQGPVAIGSDWNGVAGHVGPRFGYDACGRDLERALQAGACRKQADLSVHVGRASGRSPSRITGMKTFDFNVDGLAHVGLLPDFVADLGNIGLNEKDLEPLFNSATRFIDVWHRAETGEDLTGNVYQQLGCEDQVVAAGETECEPTDVSVATEATEEAFEESELTLTQSPVGPYDLGTTNVTLSTTATTGLRHDTVAVLRDGHGRRPDPARDHLPVRRHCGVQPDRSGAGRDRDRRRARAPAGGVRNRGLVSRTDHRVPTTAARRLAHFLRPAFGGHGTTFGIDPCERCVEMRRLPRSTPAAATST